MLQTDILAIDAHAVMARHQQIDGYMRSESAAIWCMLLKEQHATWSWRGLSPGDYLEIGTFKGKSASVLASFSRAYGNNLTLVDPEFLPEAKTALDALKSDIEYLQMRSEMLPVHELYRRSYRNIAFAHIDGMHKFAAVQNDLRVCEDLLSEFGIISIDDFHTDLYPQIPAAVYRHLYSGSSDLSIFLVGFNKAYLCRNVAKSFWKGVIQNKAQAALEALGQHLSVVNTDRNDGFDSCSITPWQAAPVVGNKNL